MLTKSYDFGQGAKVAQFPHLLLLKPLPFTSKSVINIEVHMNEIEGYFLLSGCKDTIR